MIQGFFFVVVFRCHFCLQVYIEMIFIQVSVRKRAIAFLGTLTTLRKATVSFVMSLSIRSSLRMEQLGSHWTDFYEILYLRIFFQNMSRKFVFH